MNQAPWIGRRSQPVLANFVLLAVATSLAALMGGCQQEKSLRTCPVTINVLPVFVEVPEEGYSHQFSIPNDASNARIEGEFTVDPRPQGQLQLLIVSAEGMQHWQRFLSSTASPSDSGNAELIYRGGDTIADRFNIKMTTGIFT